MRGARSLSVLSLSALSLSALSLSALSLSALSLSACATHLTAPPASDEARARALPCPPPSAPWPLAVSLASAAVGAGGLLWPRGCATPHPDGGCAGFSEPHPGFMVSLVAGLAASTVAYAYFRWDRERVCLHVSE